MLIALVNEGRNNVFRCEFAGTETSDVWTGFMSGAVYSGKKAANNVSHSHTLARA